MVAALLFIFAIVVRKLSVTLYVAIFGVFPLKRSVFLCLRQFADI